MYGMVDIIDDKLYKKGGGDVGTVSDDGLVSFPIWVHGCQAISSHHVDDLNPFFPQKS